MTITENTITNSVLNSPSFAWHPYGKLELFKTELVITPKLCVLVYVLLHSVHWIIDTNFHHTLNKSSNIPQLDGAPIAAKQVIAILNAILTIT